jgi:phosphate transport system protein
VAELTEGHTFRAYDGALSQLRLRVLAMGGLVSDQVTTAVRALLEYDRDAAQLVIQRERQVNTYDTEIEAESFRLLARRAPVASDLRTILAIGRTVTDLERAGDEAKKIARFALSVVDRMSGDPSVPVHTHLRHMAQLASRMMRHAVDALDRADESAAHEVARLDRQLDQEFEAALRRLMTVAMEHSRVIRPMIDTVFALKSLERIGDHAKNVAEHVVFLVSGTDVRHAHDAPGAVADSRH